ncbi:hypothetical protein ACFWPK_11665 [Nocardia sp. NPDC058519]|uniref:hypothetical protein n=1 Tax=Nocardia sp. NPDC058519 TaxID=3346535 RepID=UPI00365005D2
MFPLLSICALLTASSLVVLARLRYHAEMSDVIDFPRFTAAIAAVIGATLIGITEVGDHMLDPLLANILGENMSDLLKSLYLIAACALFAGQSLNTLIETFASTGTFDSRRAALIVGGVIAVALIVLSRISEARAIPAVDASEIGDIAGQIYMAIFWSVIVVTALLVTAAAIAGIHGHGLHGQLAAMVAAGMSSAIVAAYILSRLIVDHAEMTAWLTAYGQWWTVPGLIGITVAGLLGIPWPARGLRC